MFCYYLYPIIGGIILGIMLASAEEKIDTIEEYDIEDRGYRLELQRGKGFDSVLYTLDLMRYKEDWRQINWERCMAGIRCRTEYDEIEFERVGKDSLKLIISFETSTDKQLIDTFALHLDSVLNEALDSY